MVLPTTKMGITWKILCWFVFVSHIIVSAKGDFVERMFVACAFKIIIFGRKGGGVKSKVRKLPPPGPESNFLVFI